MRRVGCVRFILAPSRAIEVEYAIVKYDFCQSNVAYKRTVDGQCVAVYCRFAQFDIQIGARLFDYPSGKRFAVQCDACAVGCLEHIIPAVYAKRIAFKGICINNVCGAAISCAKGVDGVNRVGDFDFGSGFACFQTVEAGNLPYACKRASVRFLDNGEDFACYVACKYGHRQFYLRPVFSGKHNRCYCPIIPTAVDGQSCFRCQRIVYVEVYACIIAGVDCVVVERLFCKFANRNVPYVAS